MRGKTEDYPTARPDWLMIEEYARKKSEFGCILCDKTHFAKDCEHKARRTVHKEPSYTSKVYQTEPDETYGSWG
jgi:hypothetical protein